MDKVSIDGNALRRALLRANRGHLILAGVFSAAINLLYLTPSIFMLQVYDRVVPTGGIATLLLLSIAGLGGLGLLALLDWLRARILLKAAARADAELTGPVLTAILSRRSLSRTSRAVAMQEVDALRAAISGSAITALLDAPWTPIYLLVAFLLNPWLGLFTLAAALVILSLAWSNERATHRLYQQASTTAAGALTRQAHLTAYAGEIRALGMVGTLRATAIADRRQAGAALAEAGFTTAAHSGLARFVRLVAQSAALAVAALLAVNGSLSAGAITVATLLLGRTLAPIELLVGSWKTIVRARTALDQLAAVLVDSQARDHTLLPEPSGAITVEALTVTVPTGNRIAIADIGFALAPGEVCAAVGLSGAGKSTLLRALVGGVDPARGAIRLDGAALPDWDQERLGRLIGYVPQERVIFAGTVKDNVSRFDCAAGAGDGDAIDAAVVAAAKRAGAHEMILRLPAGYDTQLGHDGTGLSSGQAQRLALARACYGDPKVMILDEPCANLDSEGKAALIQLLLANRQAGVTTIFSTHDPELVNAADKVLVLAGGRVARFGPLQAVTAVAAAERRKA